MCDCEPSSGHWPCGGLVPEARLSVARQCRRRDALGRGGEVGRCAGRAGAFARQGLPTGPRVSTSSAPELSAPAGAARSFGVGSGLRLTTISLLLNGAGVRGSERPRSRQGRPSRSPTSLVSDPAPRNHSLARKKSQKARGGGQARRCTVTRQTKSAEGPRGDFYVGYELAYRSAPVLPFPSPSAHANTPSALPLLRSLTHRRREISQSRRTGWLPFPN